MENNHPEEKIGIYFLPDPWSLWRVRYAQWNYGIYAQYISEIRLKPCQDCNGTGTFILWKEHHSERNDASTTVLVGKKCRKCKGYGCLNRQGVFVYEPTFDHFGTLKDFQSEFTWSTPRQMAEYLQRYGFLLSSDVARGLGVDFRQCSECRKILTADESMAKIIGDRCELHVLRKLATTSS